MKKIRFSKESQADYISFNSECKIRCDAMITFVRVFGKTEKSSPESEPYFVYGLKRRSLAAFRNTDLMFSF
jgi:hypothetical protein